MYSFPDVLSCVHNRFPSTVSNGTEFLFNNNIQHFLVSFSCRQTYSHRSFPAPLTTAFNVLFLVFVCTNPCSLSIDNNALFREFLSIFFLFSFFSISVILILLQLYNFARSNSLMLLPCNCIPYVSKLVHSFTIF